MELENPLYGSVQLVHNFGAAAVTGLLIVALWFKSAPPDLRGLAHLACLDFASWEWFRLRHSELFHGRRSASDSSSRAGRALCKNCVRALGDHTSCVSFRK